MRNGEGILCASKNDGLGATFFENVYTLQCDRVSLLNSICFHQANRTHTIMVKLIFMWNDIVKALPLQFSLIKLEIQRSRRPHQPNTASGKATAFKIVDYRFNDVD